MNNSFKLENSGFKTTYDSGLKYFYANIFTFTSINIFSFSIVSYFIAKNFNKFAFFYPQGLWSLIAFFIVFSFIINALQYSLIQDKAWSMIFILLIALIFVESLLFAPFLILYTEKSIMIAFTISATMLLLFSMIGNYTSVNLEEYSTLFVIGILAISFTEIILGYFLNFAINTRITSVGIVFAFLFFIAYDMQTLKVMYYQNSNKSNKKLAMLGSILMFMNFVILLQRIIILLNDKKDKS